jgi:hypothetical protein
LRALDALCSPSAAMTLALASLAASASAAMALCSWTGRRTSFLLKMKFEDEDKKIVVKDVHQERVSTTRQITMTTKV